MVGLHFALPEVFGSLTYVNLWSCQSALLGCRKRKSNDSFEFTAKCGTHATVYLSDDKFSNQNGPLVSACATSHSTFSLSPGCPLSLYIHAVFVVTAHQCSASCCTQAIPGGNPCKSPCKEAGSPCQTCGPYKVGLRRALHLPDTICSVHVSSAACQAWVGNGRLAALRGQCALGTGR
jgi:hypothetical protein